jgi:hypothetical protein
MDREGKDGYWLEGNFANRFIIHKGKYYNNKLLQRLRLTLDAALTPRLTRDFSSPLLPSNNKFGLGFDLLLSSLAGLNKEHFTPAWLTIQMLHYSNGQADSFFIENEDGVKRNNYRSGDFSTNPLRMMLNLAHRSDKSIVSFGLGWQKEIDIRGPFGMSPELYNNYGKNRILFNFQWLILIFLSGEMTVRSKWQKDGSSLSEAKWNILLETSPNFRLTENIGWDGMLILPICLHSPMRWDFSFIPIQVVIILIFVLMILSL